MKAGVAEGTITPALGTWLAGFGARARPADAIHDDLRCGALALIDGDTKIGILSCDLVGLPVPLAHAWRREFAERTGIPAEHILISCTHSHSGPATGMLWETGELGEREHAYLEHLKQAMAGALEVAVARAEPARLSLARGRLRTQFNRRDRLDGRTGPVDDALGVLRVDRETGQPNGQPSGQPRGEPLALVVNYACHPTNVGANSSGFSAEYPGWVRHAVRDALGVPSLFIQGACGDHNPLSRTETGPQTGETAWQLAAIRKQGMAIGTEAARLATAEAAPLTGAAEAVLAATIRTFDAPLAPLPSLEEVADMQETANRQIAEREAAGAPEATLVWQRRLRRWPQEVVALLGTGSLPPGSGLVGGETAVPFEVQALRVGPLAIVGLPVEPFSAVGLALRDLRPGEPVWCAGYANGCYGYLAPEEEYARGGYEIHQAHRYYRRPASLASTCAAQVIEEASAALRELF